MDIHSLNNSYCSLNISSLGAELISLQNKIKNNPILWQKNEYYWNRISPLLFPFVGRLKNDRYLYEGKWYEMKQHGFARDASFKLIHSETDRLTFQWNSDAHTRVVYPFDFELKVHYILHENSVKVGFEVFNRDNSSMPFALGAHPGFHLAEPISSYRLQIPGATDWERHLIKSGLYTGKTELIRFDPDGFLALNEDLFSEDALVFKNQEINQVILWLHNQPLIHFKVNEPSAPFWGFWKKPGAPFLCIEPWWGIADSEQADGDLLKKEGMNLLAPKESANFGYQITFL